MAGKIKTRICFASLICVLALLLTSCDFRLMSKQEVEEYLEKQYGQEFTVLSSGSVMDDYYDDVWRVRAYTVSPKDNPETQFFVFNTVEGESFGVPGFRNGLQDTYSLDIFGRAFETRAAETDVEYSFNYFYPVSVAKSVSVIGGADGPTSIFVAGKIGGIPAITGIIVGIVLLAIGIFIFARKNKFHFKRITRMKKW